MFVVMKDWSRHSGPITIFTPDTWLRCRLCYNLSCYFFDLLT